MSRKYIAASTVPMSYSSKFELRAGNHARSIRCVLVVDCPNQAAILREAF
jgi:hypothetical protein